MLDGAFPKLLIRLARGPLKIAFQGGALFQKRKGDWTNWTNHFFFSFTTNLATEQHLEAPYLCEGATIDLSTGATRIGAA